MIFITLLLFQTQLSAQSYGPLTYNTLKIIESGRFNMKLQINNEGIPTEMDSYFADGNSSHTLSTDFGSIRMILLDDISYMIYDDEKVIIMMLDATMDPNAFAIDELNYSGSGTANWDDKMLAYEEYETEGEFLRFFVENGKIVGFRDASTDDNLDNIYLLRFTTDVPEHVFILPTDYEVIIQQE
jgi:hypothetical protein